MDDVGNGRIEAGNDMADRVPGTETGQVPGSKDTRKSEHYSGQTNDTIKNKCETSQ